MNKNNVINYITTTPHNINPAILNQKLDEFAESNGGSKDAVQYVAQELTEEQQMQARANLGLYGKSYDYETIATYDYYAYFQAQDPSKIECQNMDTYISAIDRVLSTKLQTREYDGLMAGNDRIYWHGNSNLIPDNHWSSNFVEKKEEEKYPDLPFVVYWTIYELHPDGAEQGNAVFDESVLTIDSSFYANFVDKSARITIYHTIPAEYLPPAIVKDRNGNSYIIIVNDDGSLSVEPA